LSATTTSFTLERIELVLKLWQNIDSKVWHAPLSFAVRDRKSLCRGSLFHQGSYPIVCRVSFDWSIHASVLHMRTVGQSVSNCKINGVNCSLFTPSAALSLRVPSVRHPAPANERYIPSSPAATWTWRLSFDTHAAARRCHPCSCWCQASW